MATYNVPYDDDLLDAGPDEDEAPPPPRVKQWEIAVYEKDRAYGGPEEGGWWYDCGQRRGICRRIFNSRDAARLYLFRLQDRLDRQNKKLRFGLGSVCYGGGHMDAAIYPRGESPRYFPAVRPHYE